MGNLIWSRQFGTPGDDRTRGVAVDAGGSAWVAGYTFGGLGGPNAGDADAFLARYDAGGRQLWIRQIGTSSTDYGLGVATDATGNSYLAGYTWGPLAGTQNGITDAFLWKCDSEGNMLWVRQLGAPGNTYGQSVAVDPAGNALITGHTTADLAGPAPGGRNAFLSKYDSAGALLWTEVLGTSGDDRSYAVTADGAHNSYIVGHTTGDLGGPSAGYEDAFLSKYDPAGRLVWTRQFGTSGHDYASAVSVGPNGGVYVAGYTSGDMGSPNAGGADIFLWGFDAAGNQLWGVQLGTPDADHAWAVAPGPGSVFLAGNTAGNLAGPSAGNYDLLVVSFVPEPRTLLMLTLGGLSFLRRKRGYAA